MNRPASPYGVAALADVAPLSGLQLLQAILEGRLPQATIGQPLAFWLAEVGEGRVVFEGEPDATMLNPGGTVHGGWALTLIDSAAACAAHSLLPAGKTCTTVDTRASFVRPLLPGRGLVRCVGRVVHAGGQLIHTEAQVFAADGKLVAHGGSTMMVLALRLPGAAVAA